MLTAFLLLGLVFVAICSAELVRSQCRRMLRPQPRPARRATAPSLSARAAHAAQAVQAAVAEGVEGVTATAPAAAA